jgi:hypothetical protein
MSPLPPSIDELTDEDRRALDSWVGEFDRRWETGLLFIRAGLIPSGCAWNVQALAEMVKIDLERLWSRGQERTVESYLERFPELAGPTTSSPA